MTVQSRAGGHVPGRGKGTEMIQGEIMSTWGSSERTGEMQHDSGSRRKSSYIGVAPKLSICAEVVGGTTATKSRPTMIVQQKEIGV